MFTPGLRCECAQPGLIDTMRKWSICTKISRGGGGRNQKICSDFSNLMFFSKLTYSDHTTK